MKRLRIGHDWELGIHESVVVEFEEQQVVVRRLAVDQWVAYSRHCPHQNADLLEAEIFDNTLRCPWHGLQFQLESGNCLTNQCTPLMIFPLAIANGEVFIYPPGKAISKKQVYMGRYGWDSRIGLFSNDLEFDLDAGVEYAAQTARGLECVSILSRTNPKEDSIITGRIVRDLSALDHPQPTVNNNEFAKDNLAPDIATLLQDELNEIAEGHQLIHVEFLLDGNAIAHLVGAPSRALGPLAAKVSQKLKLQVSFEFAKFGE